MRTQANLERIERVTSPLLTLLAIALVPILLIPLTSDPNEVILAICDTADVAIWATFAVVFAVKLVVAPAPLPYLKRNWFEAVLVVIPFARPLRLLRTVRLLAVLGINARLVSRLAESRGARTAAVVVIMTIVAAGTLMWLIERRQPDPNIRRPADGMWWALTTVTTVGYGDYYPTSPAGRVVAGMVMLIGIAALSAVTAAIAAGLVRDDEESESDRVATQLQRLEAEVRALREQLAASAHGPLDNRRTREDQSPGSDDP